MKTPVELGAAAALLAALLGSPVLAQGTAPAGTAPPPGSQTAIPEKVAPPQDGIAEPAPGRSLSDHLDGTNGVLVPNGDPDPGIAVQPPDTGPGSTIVIPPPGSPGGDPTVQPK